MKKFVWGLWLTGVTVLALTVAAVPASATSITVDLTLSGGASLGTIPYGSVKLDDQGGTGDIIVTVTMFNGNKMVNTGFTETIAFNLTPNPAAGITISGFSAGNWVVDGAGQPATDIHMDGLGHFEYGVLWTGGNGANGFPGPLSFHVTTPGIDLSWFNEKSTPNGPGALSSHFAVDIWSGQTGNTGVVGDEFDDICEVLVCTPGQQNFDTPEPASLFLLGTGLIAAAVGIRRRKR